ncbi:MAG TPA: protease HtpX, partial [Moraxellaceae bacterium]|nr:protease HtpX [Moraxellaceae bacterium]
MLRIALFLLTNLAIIVVAGIVLSILGVGSSHGAGNTLQLG